MRGGVLVLLALLQAPRSVFAARAMIHDMLSEDAADEGQAGAFAPRPGLSLGRYELVGHLRGAGGAWGRVAGAPNASALLEGWPDAVRSMSIRYGTDATKLGRGGFGEVWKAKDKLSGRDVAIKFFLAPFHEPYPYLYWSRCSEYDQKKLAEASVECRLTQSLLARAADDPAGASHISACLEDHVRPTGNEGGSQVAYLVLQIGGQELFNWYSEKAAKPPEDPTTARKAMTQLLQALRFLQKQDPSIIHHDLKLENIVYQQRGDDLFIKLIDWGGALTGTAEDQKGGYVYTASYKPPEVQVGVAMAEPWWSYDIYSSGIVYLLLLCPGVTTTEIHRFLTYDSDPDSPQRLIPLVSGRCPAGTMEDFTLIQQMVQSAAKLRPSPSELLESSPLSELVQEEVRDEDKPPQLEVEVNSTKFLVHELKDMAGDGRIRDSDSIKKCCCNTREGECRLVDLTVPHPTCSQSWFKWRRESCSCLIDSGWRSFRRVGAGICIATHEEELPDDDVSSDEDGGSSD
jgi:serine/threonine protein kinase